MINKFAPNSPEIKIIIWDNDNTLVATAENHFQKHLITAKKYNITLDDDHRPIIAANNGKQNWQWLRDDFGLTADQDTYLSEIDACYKENAAKLKPNPGIIEAIAFCRDQMMSQIIFSNSRRDSLMISVEANGFESDMSLIWGKEDYQGRKYTAQPYEMLLDHLKDQLKKPALSFENMIFFDDDAKCIEAALALGICAIHIGNGPNPEAPDSACYAFADKGCNAPPALASTAHIIDLLKDLI